MSVHVGRKFDQRCVWLGLESQQESVAIDRPDEEFVGKMSEAMKLPFDLDEEIESWLRAPLASCVYPGRQCLSIPHEILVRGKLNL